jgi:hypothetical protein
MALDASLLVASMRLVCVLLLCFAPLFGVSFLDRIGQSLVWIRNYTNPVCSASYPCSSSITIGTNCSASVLGFPPGAVCVRKCAKEQRVSGFSTCTAQSFPNCTSVWHPPIETLACIDPCSVPDSTCASDAWLGDACKMTCPAGSTSWPTNANDFFCGNEHPVCKSKAAMCALAAHTNFAESCELPAVWAREHCHCPGTERLNHDATCVPSCVDGFKTRKLLRPAILARCDDGDLKLDAPLGCERASVLVPASAARFLSHTTAV